MLNIYDVTGSIRLETIIRLSYRCKMVWKFFDNFFTNVYLSKTTVWFVSVVYFCMSFIILIYENDYSKIYIAIIFVNTKKTGLSWK